MKPLIIGRSGEADIRIDNDTVSSIHAELTETKDGRYYFVDRKSSNGTFVYRDGQWSTLTQGYLTADEPIEIGEYRTSIAKLLQTLSRKEAKPAPAIPDPEPIPPRKPYRDRDGEIRYRD